MVDLFLYKFGFISLYEDMVYCNKNFRSGTVFELGFVEFVRVCNESVLIKDLDDFDVVLSGVQDKVYEVFFLGKNVYDRIDRDEVISFDIVIEGKYVLESSVFDIISICKEIEKEQKKNIFIELKVDEFGRLVK